ncbi:hypothetical protein BDA99DRAFT_523704 [Phascolomyces articulosus]|uniref:Uncharacterized protein n=1 Tax=Phascolomyces articulosus TaxID=60185 RepID=A0AAD5JZR0_9FUNG|nr:hypothetical protein BDA99DRAFT_523704 [Phascolomyces articulosus]
MHEDDKTASRYFSLALFFTYFFLLFPCHPFLNYIYNLSLFLFCLSFFSLSFFFYIYL